MIPVDFAAAGALFVGALCFATGYVGGRNEERRRWLARARYRRSNER